MMKQIGRELSHHSRPVNGSATRCARLACLHLSPFQQGPLRETSTILASTRTARRSQYRSSMAFLIDNSTLTRASDGDPAALTRLATMLRPHIEKQLLRYPVTDEDRRDLVQATLMQVIRRVGSFRGDASFSTWLFRVTANEALMLMRSQRRHRTRVVGGLDLEDSRKSTRGERPTARARSRGERCGQRARRSRSSGTRRAALELSRRRRVALQPRPRPPRDRSPSFDDRERRPLSLASCPLPTPCDPRARAAGYGDRRGLIKARGRTPRVESRSLGRTVPFAR